MNNYIQLSDAQKQAVLTQCKNMMGMCDSMIYGEKPTFAELMESMAELERRFRERE